MKNFTFLALQGPDGTEADLGALSDAATTHGGRLNVLHIAAVPLLPSSVAATPYGMPVIPEEWTRTRNEMAERLAAQQPRTRDYLQDRGITGEVGTICVEPAALHNLVAQRSLFVDLSVVQDSMRANESAFDNVVYGLLFEGPGPVMLNAEKNDKSLAPANVMVAWNNSLPAIRAIRAALPLLRLAGEVTIACFDADATRWADGDSPGADLAVWLSHHGCRVTVQEYASGRKDVGHAILDRARESAADLIVMGAYGRRRWNERFFGGTTETLIGQRDYPVLLCH